MLNGTSDKVPSPDAAITGYQSAIDLWTFSSGQGWERFNIMLAANSILIAALGLTHASDGPTVLFGLVLPLLGIVLSLIWYLLVRRSFDYAEYFTFIARELEEAHFAPTVTTVARGAAFSRGDTIIFAFGSNRHSHRLSKPGRVIRARTASYIVIVLFFVFYGLALCLYFN